MNEGPERSTLRVPDAELDFGPDLVMQYRGQPFTGIAFDVTENGTRSELTYVDGLQHGPARDWDASGRLRAEDSWRANVRHGVSRTYDENGAVISEQRWDHDRMVNAPPSGA
ncbi:toxin-antitoxin system YwqK family antitoxin [Kribbella sp. NPDC004138]